MPASNNTPPSNNHRSDRYLVTIKRLLSLNYCQTHIFFVSLEIGIHIFTIFVG